ncbi:MAG: phosphoribosylamine--glycine ligase [Pseudomonadota bacterium]
MKILVIGSGGREHALAWQLARHGTDRHVFVAPGNAGTALEANVTNVAIAATDEAALLDFALRERIALTVVGPEQPLVAGLVDRFQAAGLKCFGPTAAAAQLEGSKSFAKAFFDRHGIPTARWQRFTEIDAANAYIDAEGAPIVVKADGLAAGKGVVVAATIADAKAAVVDMLGEHRFGDAGASVVIEECLVGEEASFIVVAAGQTAVPLATSQDHKARDNDDKGPNTGGMGAVSPAPIIDAELAGRIERDVIAPTLQGLAADGIDYCGFLYAGLMITADGTPKVLEFNCRLGDPETQPILMRLESDLAGLCLAAIENQLTDVSIAWHPKPTVGVVMAASGYPGDYQSGEQIGGLDQFAGTDVKVFHAGTTLDGDRVLTSGGRVLCVVGRGQSVEAAQRSAYAAVAAIDWSGAYYRTDIGHHALRHRA